MAKRPRKKAEVYGTPAPKGMPDIRVKGVDGNFSLAKYRREVDFSEVIAKCEEYINNWRTIGNSVPTVSGMATYCDWPKKKMEKLVYETKRPEFVELAAMVKSIQEVELIDKGLSGHHNAAITKLLLMKHGYMDSTESGVSVTVNIDRSCGGAVVDGETIDHDES